MTHEDNLLRLAQVTKECPNCNGTGEAYCSKPSVYAAGTGEPDPKQPRCAHGDNIRRILADWTLAVDCPDCHGTGRVLLIEGVRVECIHARGGTVWGDKNYPRCFDCRARGWTPSTDKWPWFHALSPFLRGKGSSFPPASFDSFVQAAVNALEAAGVLEKEEA